MKRLIAMLLTFAMLMSFMSVSAFAAENEPDTGIITEDITWENGAIINGATIKGDVTITVKGTVVIAGTIKMASDSIHKVTIKGGTADAKLIRGNGFTGQMFYVEGSICYFQDLIFENITLDGGAVWTGDVDPILNRGTTNEGIKATGSILYLVRANATLNNCTLQNQDDSTGEKGNAVFLREYASIAFNDSVVRNNNSPSGYWKGGVVTTRYGGIVTAKNSEVCGNSASHGGFVGISSSGSYGTKVECVNTKIHHNYASTAGAAFYLQDNGSKIAKTHGDNGAGYLKLTGCTLENNGSPDGLIYSYVYYMPAWIKDTTIENNDCAVYTYHSDNRSFSVAGDIKIAGSHSGYLFENPIRIFDALGTSASIPMSEASVSQLMSKYGYLATATPDIPYHYNHTGNGAYVLTYEYTWRNLHNITLADLAQLKLYENNGYTNWVLTDVDGNGMLDAVPVSVEPTTVNVTLIDNFKGSKESETQAVSYVVENVPVCHFEHPGYFFNGWIRADGTLIKDASSNVILNDGEVLTATWAVARPTVAIKPADNVICLKEGQSATLTATIGNQNAENLTYSYQWYRDGVAIEGATNATYTATEAKAGDYVYKCVVTAADDVYGTNTYNKSIVLHYDAVNVVEIVETGVKYPSIRDAVEAAENGQTIRVLKDHEMDVSELTQNAVVFIDGTKTQKLTIDFNGKNVTANTGDNTSGDVWTIFYARYGAEVTVTGDGNVTIVGDDLNRPYMFWASASTITMEDGTYIMDGTPTQGAKNGAVSHTFYASSGGHIYIKNGFYGNINSKIDLMNLRDGSGSSIVVTGGTYTEYFPNTEQPWEVTVPDGYTIIDNGNGTWSVNPYVTVIIDDQTMVRGEKVPELTYTIDYGYLAEEVVNVSVVIDAITAPAAGEHTITGTATLSDGTGKAENYAVKIVLGKLTVTVTTYSINYRAGEGKYVGNEPNSGDNWMIIKNGYTYNEAVTLHSGEGFQREGYKLVGWTINGVDYELGETVEKNFTNVQGGTVQAYAIWELDEDDVLIEDEDVPLAPDPSEPEASDPTDPSEPETTVPETSEPDEDIEDEDLPLGSDPSGSTEVPKAGDNSVFRSMIIGTLALVAMAVLVLNKKKYFID